MMADQCWCWLVCWFGNGWLMLVDENQPLIVIFNRWYYTKGTSSWNTRTMSVTNEIKGIHHCMRVMSLYWNMLHTQKIQGGISNRKLFASGLGRLHCLVSGSVGHHKPFETCGSICVHNCKNIGHHSASSPYIPSSCRLRVPGPWVPKAQVTPGSSRH